MDARKPTYMRTLQMGAEIIIILSSLLSYACVQRVNKSADRFVQQSQKSYTVFCVYLHTVGQQDFNKGLADEGFPLATRKPICGNSLNFCQRHRSGARNAVYRHCIQAHGSSGFGLSVEARTVPSFSMATPVVADSIRNAIAVGAPIYNAGDPGEWQRAAPVTDGWAA